MSIIQIIEHYHELAARRSLVLKDIREKGNEVASIEDRIADLKNAGKSFDSRDVVRAKDKKKRLLQDIAEHEHAVRMLDAEMETTRMKVTGYDGE